MGGSPLQLAERLRSEGEKTCQFFDGLSGDHWEQVVYTEGSGWRVWQILAHFVASEASLRKLVENILAGGPGSSEDFDLNRYNESKVRKLGAIPVEELLRQFRELRRDNVEFVSVMQVADLEKTGRHPFLGMARLEDIIKLIYRHNQIHQREIRKALAQAGDVDLSTG